MQKQLGTVYFLRLDTPLGNPETHTAEFYTGWTTDLDKRLAEHRAGRGSAFTRAAVERGIGFSVIHQIEGGRSLERAIKNKKNVRRFLRQLGVL